ncbi:helix-turn-helix transcriptional regulator [Arundinibacter roseus]|uniref:Helix-turn-helix transcriptional regulator n=1 Tax=Arundinibacter roseus TaxID=2070510 RepID=A0A4R4K5C0_9BACT|nr:LuxR C-terminal-related transcriptional regulator [Arundinibacter roseus]TDB61349.1 helix-turn-helix transcriptional regulator [Arundinibacter roseus]
MNHQLKTGTRAITLHLSSDIGLDHLLEALQPTFNILIREPNLFDLQAKEVNTHGIEDDSYDQINRNYKLPVEKEVKKKPLSPKELQILELISKGQSYEQVAENLNMNINGIRYYIKKVYQKLNVNNSREAAYIYSTSLSQKKYS